MRHHIHLAEKLLLHDAAAALLLLLLSSLQTVCRLSHGNSTRIFIIRGRELHSNQNATSFHPIFLFFC
jgi:hypothetical protein